MCCTALFMATGNLVPYVLQLRVSSLCTMHPPNMQTEIVVTKGK